jgi:heptosyltransferase-2
MLSPFLRELRAFLPGAWITLVAGPAGYEVAELCPYVDEVLVYDHRVRRFWRPVVLPLRALRLGRGLLRARRFELCVVPRWDTDGYFASLLGYLSGAPHRLGFSEKVTPRKKRLNRGFDRFFTRVLTDDAPRHEVERNELLLRALGATPQSGALELWLGADDEAFAERVLQQSPPTSGGLRVGMHLGAGAAQRRWPVESFVALARWIRASQGASFVVVGGHSEREMALQFSGALGDNVTVVVGEASVRQTAALLSRCNLFVGNDSGPKHLAAAAAVPVVEISNFPANGPPWHWNSPVRFAAWGVPHRVVQPARPLAPCQGWCSAREPHCIREVSVEQARSAVAELLAETGLSGYQPPA